MLEPSVVEVAATQVPLIEGRLDDLRQLGLEYERFGEAAYRLRSAPFLPGPTELLQLAREALAAASEQDLYWRDRLLATVACRSAVKKGRGLPVPRAAALVDELFHRGPPTVCPHGSPLMLQLSRPFLRRQFRW
jgi:DNA mismatch repair protein MutL